MMEVYGDLYLLLNALCDLLVLSLCAAILRRPVKKRRLLLGAAIGGAFALLSLFLPRLWSTVCSFPAAFLMVFAVFSFGGVKRYLFTTLVFYLCSFFLSGVVSFISKLLNERLPAPLSALLLLALLTVAGFAALLYGEIIRRRPALPYARLRFTYLQKTYECCALCDSGNLLRDEQSGLPVILLSPALIPPPEGARQIGVHTVSSGETMPLLDICAVTVNDRAAEACAAVCPSARAFTHHDALLPAALIPHNAGKADRKKGFRCLRFSKK